MNESSASKEGDEGGAGGGSGSVVVIDQNFGMTSVQQIFNATKFPPSHVHGLTGTIGLKFRYIAGISQRQFAGPIDKSSTDLAAKVLKFGTNGVAKVPYQQFADKYMSCLYIAARPKTLITWGDLAQVVDMLEFDLLDRGFYYSLSFTVVDDKRGLIADGGLAVGVCLTPPASSTS